MRPIYPRNVFYAHFAFQPCVPLTGAYLVVVTFVLGDLGSISRGRQLVGGIVPRLGGRTTGLVVTATSEVEGFQRVLECRRCSG